ncbi:MAG: putative motility protein [Hungatella sp.]|nr:putative motility protein [Hungatella sp.]
MDISALSSMSTSQMVSNMGVALLSKVLDTAEVTGEALNEMIETASVPVSGLGEYLDIRV